MLGSERPAHSTLLAAGVPVLENLTGLDQLPATGATCTPRHPASRRSARSLCVPRPLSMADARALPSSMILHLWSTSDPVVEQRPTGSKVEHAVRRLTRYTTWHSAILLLTELLPACGADARSQRSVAHTY